MRNKFKELLYRYKIYNAQLPLATTDDLPAQEATESVSARVGRAFAQQNQRINSMARVAHHCDDPLSCTKTNCWSFVADSIIDTSIVPLKTREQRVKELKDR